MDNIVLKALRKEPERRYSSVEQFSEDVRRHLNGLPIMARPATFGYRAEKFVRRNSSAIVAALLIFLTLIGGIAATSWQAARAERERKLAEKRFGEVRNLAKNIIYKYHDEIKNLSGATRAREMLVSDALDYLNRLEEDVSGGDILLERELSEAYMRVGDVQGEPYQANAGDTAGAIESYRKAIFLLEDISKKSTADLALKRSLRQARQQLCSLLLRAGDKNVLDAARQSIEISEQITAAPDANNDDALAQAKSYIFLGDVLPLGTGENESVQSFRRALKIVEPIAENEPDNINAVYRLTALNQRLGFHYSQMGERAAEIEKSAEAEEMFRSALPFYQRTIDLSKRLVGLDPQNANYRRNLSGAEYDEACIERRLGNMEKAVAVLLKVLDERRAAVENDSENVQALADLGEVNSDLSLVYLAKKQFPLAVKFARAANFAIDEAVRRDSANQEYKGGRYHAYLLYGDALAAQNDFEGAIKVYKNSFEEFNKTVKAGNRPDMAVLESTMHEKSGDALANWAAAEKLSPVVKRVRLANARLEYQKALELMPMPNSDDSTSRRNVARHDYFAAKLARCEAALNAL